MGKGFEDLEIYQRSLALGDTIHTIVSKWDWFAKDTIGKQIVRSMDSVAANISEGFGRYYYKDRIRFIYYSRGSLFETRTWLVKAMQRKLIDSNVYDSLNDELIIIGVKLNNYIHSINVLYSSNNNE